MFFIMLTKCFVEYTQKFKIKSNNTATTADMDI